MSNCPLVTYFNLAYIYIEFMYCNMGNNILLLVKYDIICFWSLFRIFLVAMFRSFFWAIFLF